MLVLCQPGFTKMNPARDKHYGEWLSIWNELTQTSEKVNGYDAMIGNVEALTGNAAAETTPAYTCYVPLQFWFCRNPGLALPLIALQYHEVKFNISFRPVTQCYTLSAGTISPATPAISNASLYVDYIYLDTDERRQFAQVQHEYLIEQLQFTGAESFSNSSVKSKLALNHPCKALYWVLHTQAREDANQWSNFTNASGADTIVDAKLQLNGHDRFSTRKAGYFNLVQPYCHHTAIPSTGIYCYSFALNPEQHQPSGTVNMSRIDNATLMLNTTTSTNAFKLRVYAVNYNVLRIMAGINDIIFHLCPTVSCLLSSLNYLVGKTVKNQRPSAIWLYNWLVNYIQFATTSNCGKLLRVSTTILMWKHIRRTRLMAEPNGKNVENWTIRSQGSFQCTSTLRNKVQRLNGVGELNLSFLRYSPAHWETIGLKVGAALLLVIKSIKINLKRVC